MKFKGKRFLAAFVVLLMLSLGFIALAQTGAMAEQMEMMRQMMMNRPQAMNDADAAIQQQKANAMAEGAYGCCLHHSCDFCALKMGMCPCGMNAATDKAVCNECKGGWHAGDGAVAGKTADDIKTMPRME